MTAVHPDTSRQAVMEAALVLLQRMGLTAADLAAVPQPGKPVPTFAEYVPVVSWRGSWVSNERARYVLSSRLRSG
jgi:hypothetical protein